jgi:methoxymalonate biosynthesis acyl carrier protein
MTEAEVAQSVEAFVRKQFAVSESDPDFGPTTDLFDGGYVDSVGLAELLGFIEDRFRVSVPDEELLSEEFASIEGIARTVNRLNSATTHSGDAG